MPTFVNHESGKEYSVSLLDLFTPSSGNKNDTGKCLRQTRPSVRPRNTVKSKNSDSNKASTPSDKVPIAEAKEKHNETPGKEDATLPAEVSGAPAEDDGWTAAEEAQLIQLKEEKQTWAQISTTLNRPKKELTLKYGELTKAKRGTEGLTKPPKKDNETKEGKDTDTKGKAKKYEMETDAALFANLMNATDPLDIVEVGMMQHSLGTDEGEQLEVQEILMICRMHDYFENQKWVAIASELFNVTGKRVPPDVLRHTFLTRKLVK